MNYLQICIVLLVIVNYVPHLTVDALLPGEVVVRSKDKDKCTKPLTNSPELVPDSAFTASSIYSNSFFFPYKARLLDIVPEESKKDKAWCPENPIQGELKEWIQVEFTNIKFIRAIFTAGRGEGNFAEEFVPFFVIKYQREDNGRWFEYKTTHGNRIIDGNTDPRNIQRIHFDPMFLAKRVRIYPYEKRVARSMCLRFALFGCDYEDGVVEYRIPQGDTITFNTGSSSGERTYQLLDYTYDGEISAGNQLSGGMGQLMDNIAFRERLQLDMDIELRPGHHFIGWKKSGLGHPVTIVFRFDNVRNFSLIRLSTFNSVGENIGIFSSARIEFSVGGEYFDRQEPVVKTNTRDTRMSNVRWIDIHLEHRYGRFLRVSLFFDVDWILLTEIAFTSEIIPLAMPVESPPKAKPLLPPNGGVRSPGGSKQTGKPNSGKDALSEAQPSLSPNGKHQSSRSGGRVPSHKDLTYIVAIVCCFLGSLICAALVAFILLKLRRHRKKKMLGMQCGGGTVILGVNHHSIGNQYSLNLDPLSNGNRGSGTSAHRPLLKDSSLYNNVPTDDEDDCLMASLVGANGGSEKCPLSASSVLPYAAYSVGPTRHSPDNRIPLGPEYASTTLFNQPPPSYHSGGPYASGAIHPLQLIPNSMMDMDGRNAGNGGCYSPGLSLKPGLTVQIPPPPVPRFPQDLCIQGVTGNTVYAAPRDLMELSNGPSSGGSIMSDSNLNEVPLSQLRLLEKLGGGQFGEVHLAEWASSTLSNEEEGEVVEGRRLVAVKMLRKDANEQARRDFQCEIGVLSRLSDPNIVRMLGVCREQGSLCVLVEYMKHGDLHQFLRTKRLASTGHTADSMHISQTGALTVSCTGSDGGDGTEALSYGCLIYIAAQVASGMKHLESLGLVHRDLACRNCLVGSKFTIKIADFGMCRRLYATDYYRIEGRAILPIRWMAWESILQGRFTSKSDVWSFGVTLWEVLTYCSSQPLAHLTNEEVIENCGHAYAEDGLAQYPPCPANCPKEIYDLMLECWHKREGQRPAFREVHMFLQRKNLGFNPEEEYQLTRASAGAISPMLT